MIIRITESDSMIRVAWQFDLSVKVIELMVYLCRCHILAVPVTQRMALNFLCDALEVPKRASKIFIPSEPLSYRCGAVVGAAVYDVAISHSSRKGRHTLWYPLTRIALAPCSGSY
jgi:hypothetical protein